MIKEYQRDQRDQIKDVGFMTRDCVNYSLKKSVETYPTL